MQDVKSFLASKTVWGALIAILPQIMALFGFDMSAEDAQGVAGNVEAIISAAGGLIAIYGRVTATKAISIRRRNNGT